MYERHAGNWRDRHWRAKYRPNEHQGKERSEREQYAERQERAQQIRLRSQARPVGAQFELEDSRHSGRGELGREIQAQSAPEKGNAAAAESQARRRQPESVHGGG